MNTRLALAVAAIAAVVAAAAVPGGRESRAVERRQGNEARLERGVVVVGHYSTDAGELIRLAIPSVSMRGNPIADQTCFVWRDPEFRSSTLHCPGFDTIAD